MKSLLTKTDRSSRSIRALGLGLALLLVGMSMATYYSRKGTASSGKVSNRSSLVPASDKAAQAKVKAPLGKLPLAFEPNKGQTAPQVKYIARASGYTAFLTADGATLRVKGNTPGVLRMTFENAQAAHTITPSDKQVGVSNYLIGNDRSKWLTGIPHYGKVRYADVYKGIDVAYSGNQRRVEYDFVVQPGADPRQIRVGYEGSSRFDLNKDGDLELETSAGITLSRKPVIYQTVRGKRTSVTGEYALLSNHEVGFKVGDYDKSLPLIIDPTVQVLADEGGNGDDQALGVAVSPASATTQAAFITGKTSSVATGSPAAGGFPVTAAPILQGKSNGGVLGYDAFVQKLTKDGNGNFTILAYSTYLGGTGDDAGTAIATDSSGNAYVTGSTTVNGPVLANLFPTVPAVTAFPGGSTLAFAAELNSTGTALTYSSLLGSAAVTSATSIVLDSSNNAYIGGWTSNNGLGNSVALSAFNGYGGGNSDGFVAEFNTSGTPVFTSYVGGPLADVVNGIALDSKNNIVVAGTTTGSTNINNPNVCNTGGCTTFPTTNGGVFTTTPGTNGFVVKMAPLAASLTWSQTFGNGAETVQGLTLDPSNNIYIVGASGSPGFGPTQSPYNTPGKNPTSVLGGLIPPPVYGNVPGAGNSAGYLLALNASATAARFVDYGPTVFNVVAATVIDISGNFLNPISVPIPVTNNNPNSLLATAGVFNGVAIDGSQQLYVVGNAQNLTSATSGSDAFVERFSSTGNGYSYTASGNPLASSNIGTPIGGLTNMNGSMTGLVVTLGGGGNDSGNAIAVTNTDQAVIAGTTNSSNAASLLSGNRVTPMFTTATQTNPGQAGTVSISVANTAGIIIGESVQAANLLQNTTVANIVGNTVTLNAIPTSPFPVGLGGGINGGPITFLGSTSPVVSTTATGTIGSFILTLGSGAGVTPGMFAVAPGLLGNTTVTTAPVGLPPVVIVGAATWANNSTTITVPTAQIAGIQVGQTVTSPAAGLQTGTMVASVGSSSVLVNTTAVQPNVGATSILVANSTGIAAGQVVTSSATPSPIPAGTSVASIGAGGNAVMTTTNCNDGLNSSSITVPGPNANILVGQTVAGVGIPTSPVPTVLAVNPSSCAGAPAGSLDVALSAQVMGTVSTGTQIIFTGTTINLNFTLPATGVSAALANTPVSFNTATTAIGISLATTAAQTNVNATFTGGATITISQAIQAPGLNQTPINFETSSQTLGYPGALQALPVSLTGITNAGTTFGKTFLPTGVAKTTTSTLPAANDNDAFFAAVQFQDLQVNSSSGTNTGLTFTTSPGGTVPAPGTLNVQYLITPNAACQAASVAQGNPNNDITLPGNGTVPTITPTQNAFNNFTVTYNGNLQYSVQINAVPANPGVYVGLLTLGNQVGGSLCADNTVTVPITLNVGTPFSATAQGATIGSNGTQTFTVSEAFNSGQLSPGSPTANTTGNALFVPVQVNAGSTGVTYGAAVVNIPGVSVPTFVPSSQGATVTGANAFPTCNNGQKLVSFELAGGADTGNINNVPNTFAFTAASVPSGTPAPSTAAQSMPAFYLVVQPSNNAAGAAVCTVQPGTYTETIAVTPNVGTAVNITIVINVTGGVNLNNNFLNFAFPSNTSPAQQQSPTLFVSTLNGINAPYQIMYIPFTCTTPNTCPGTPGQGAPLPAANVVITPTSGTVSSTQTISMVVQVSPTGLAAGNAYGGTITVAPPFGATGTANFAPLTVQVIASVGGNIVVAEPSGGNLNVTLPVNYAAIAAPFSSLPGGNITLFDGQQPTGAQITINGSLQNGPSQPPGISIAGTTVTLSSGSSSTPLPAGTLTINTPANATAGGGTLSCFSFAGTTPCVFVPPGSALAGNTQVNYPITFNTVGLAPNTTYTGTITFTGCINNGNACTTSTTNTTQATVNVTLVTTAAPTIYGLSNPANGTPSSPISSTNPIVLTGQVGQTTICTNTTGQALNNPTFFTTAGTLGNVVFSVGSGSFITYPVTGTNNPLTGVLNANSNGSGLVAFPAGTAPTLTSYAGVSITGSNQAQVCVNPQLLGLNPGIYTGTINVTAAGAANSPFPVPVTLILNNTPGHIELSNTGIFRSGTFFLNLNQTTYNYSPSTTLVDSFGAAGDQPVAGDWLGTGVVSIGVFRGSAGAWYLDLNNDGIFEANEGPFWFGSPGDTAVTGDWTGSGSTKIGVYRGGTWYLLYTTLTGGPTGMLQPGTNLYSYAGNVTQSFTFGTPTDLPVVNNWSGTGNVDQIGVFRCTTAGVSCSWIVDNVGTGVYSTSDPVYTFGAPGDLPVVGDWNDNGQRKRIGVYRPSTGQWYLDVNGSNAYAPNDIVGVFGGVPGDKPVVGKWTE